MKALFLLESGELSAYVDLFLRDYFQHFCLFDYFCDSLAHFQRNLFQTSLKVSGKITSRIFFGTMRWTNYISWSNTLPYSFLSWEISKEKETMTHHFKHVCDLFSFQMTFVVILLAISFFSRALFQSSLCFHVSMTPFILRVLALPALDFHLFCHKLRSALTLPIVLLPLHLFPHPSRQKIGLVQNKAELFLSPSGV